MKFNTYTTFARGLPTLITVVPFFVLHYFFLSPTLGKFWGELLGLKIITDITFVSALFFLAMQINRIVSKEIIEKKIFGDGLKFPTTNFLLHLNSHFSSDYTQKIHDRIKSNFDINIPTRTSEFNDEEESRKIISEAVSHIRIKVGKGKLLGQHNLEYGFARNLFGGSIVACVVSIVDILIFKWIYPNNIAFLISIAIFFIYLVFILVALKMTDSTGKAYAKVLFQEYMALN